MDFNVTEGIMPNQISQLIKFSNTDKIIMKTTSDATRFRDKKSFYTWRKKGKKIYTMEDQLGKLLGIVWFGEKRLASNKKFIKKFDFKKYGITFSIRIYTEARGKGLSYGFMRDSWERFKKTKDYNKNPNNGIWLETNQDNLPAVSLYKKFGFETISASDENGRIIMILGTNHSK